jgi:hypothetical protein
LWNKLSPSCRAVGLARTTQSTAVEDEQRLVSYRGVSFQLADLPGKASWKLAPQVNSHLPLA